MNLWTIFILLLGCFVFAEANNVSNDCAKNPKKKGCPVVKKSDKVGKPSKPPSGATPKKPDGKSSKQVDKPGSKPSKPGAKPSKPLSKPGVKPTTKKPSKSGAKPPTKPPKRGVKPTKKGVKPSKKGGKTNKPKPKDKKKKPGGKPVRILHPRNSKKGCPKLRMRNKCRCKYDPKSRVKVSVFCQNVRNGSELAHSLRVMSGYRINSLSLRNIKIAVPPPLFRGLSIQQISMTNSDLAELSDSSKRSIFTGLESSLTGVNFVNMHKMKSWDFSKLSGMYRLKTVSITQSELRSVNTDLSRAARGHLAIVMMTKTQMKALKPNIFAGQHALTTVWLQSNNFSTLKRSMFPRPANKLASFSVMDNKQLSTLPDDVFVSMPALRSVNLQNNRLSTLSEKMFAPVWKKLAHLKVAGNPFKCDCKMKWMVKTNRRPQVNDLMSAKCATPANLKGRTLTSLKTKDLKC